MSIKLFKMYINLLYLIFVTNFTNIYAVPKKRVLANMDMVDMTDMVDMLMDMMDTGVNC